MNNHKATSYQSRESGNKDKYSFSNAVTDLEEEVKGKVKKLHFNKAPLHVLPKRIRDLISELSGKNKFPADFSLLNLLFVFSLAIGGRKRVKVKGNWLEPANLYVCCVAAPGHMKTPVQSHFAEPLKNREYEWFKEFEKEKQEFDQLEKTATKKNPNPKERPARKQILIQDSTSEALVYALSNNPHGLGLINDEIAGLFGNMNKYNKGDDAPLYLSCANAEPISINRKTSNSIYIKQPYLCIAGGTQPGVLVNIFSNQMIENGMLPRFLFAYPDDLRKEGPTWEEVNDSLIRHYHDTVTFLLKDVHTGAEKDEKDTFSIVEFENDAKELLFEYLENNADRVNEMNDLGNERLASMYVKFDYHVIRLSFILQVIHDADAKKDTTTINKQSVKGGIELADYFIRHSLRIYQLISGDPLSRYSEDKKEFITELPDIDFSLSEAYEIAFHIRSAHSENKSTIEKWVRRTLDDKKIFLKIKHGVYKKKNA